MESLSKKTTADWIQDLSDPRWMVRRAAAEALGQSRSEEAVGPLVELLQHEDWKTVRAEVIRALGRLGDTRGVEAILEALQDEDLHLRQAARQACEAYGSPQLAPRLLQLLRADYLQLLRADVSSFNDFLHRVEELQTVVVEALVSLGTGVVPWVVEALQDRNWRVQQAAIQVLGEVGGPPAMERLSRLARRWSLGERVEVKEAARQAMARIQERLVGAEAARSQ